MSNQDPIYKRINVSKINEARKTNLRFKLSNLPLSKEVTNLSLNPLKSEKFSIDKANTSLYTKHKLIEHNASAFGFGLGKSTLNSNNEEIKLFQQTIDKTTVNYSINKEQKKAKIDDLNNFQKLLLKQKELYIENLKEDNTKRYLKGKVAKAIKEEKHICSKFKGGVNRINVLVALSIDKERHKRKYLKEKEKPEYEYKDQNLLISKLEELKNENLSTYLYDINKLENSLLDRKELLMNKLTKREFDIIVKDPYNYGNFYSDKSNNLTLLQRFKKEEKEAEAKRIFKSLNASQSSNSINLLNAIKEENSGNSPLKLNDITYRNLLKDKINQKIKLQIKQKENTLKKKKIIEDISSRILSSGLIKYRQSLNRSKITKETNNEVSRRLNENIHLRRKENKEINLQSLPVRKSFFTPRDKRNSLVQNNSALILIDRIKENYQRHSVFEKSSLY